MRYLHRLALFFLLVGASINLLEAQTPPGTTIKVENAWSRATPGGSKTGVVYMTLVNGGASADRLIGGTTPIAQAVQFHSNINDNGVMRMRELTGIDIAPGSKVTLKPGSTHAMLVGLKQPLKEGQSFPLTLEFEKAGKLDVTIPIEKIGATEHQNMNGM